MRDGIDFQRSVARFSDSDVAYIVDVLRGAYSIMSAADSVHGVDDSDAKLLLGDFISALDECDSIEIADEEFLVDEN